MRVRLNLYQLRRYAHFASSAPHAAFKNIRNSQLLPDLAQIALRARGVIRNARARDNLEIGDFSERGQNIILHSLCEKCVLLVSAEIREWQHGNAFFGNENPGRWNFAGHLRWI